MEQPTPDSSTQKPKEKRKINKFLGCLIIIVFVIVVSAIVQSISGVKMNSNTPSQSTTASSLNVDNATLKQINQYPGLADLLSGDNGRNQPTLKSFAYDLSMSSITIEFNMKSDMSQKDAIGVMHTKMSDIYMAIYKGTVKQPNFVILKADAPLTDQYGNNSYDTVYTTRLGVITADKINWNDDTSDLENRIIPNPWTIVYNDQNQY